GASAAGADLTNTVFDDYAPTLITAGAGPYTGTFRPVPGLLRASVSVGGSGYKVGDTLTVQGGNALTAAQLRVTAVGAGGAVTAVTILQAGAYTALPFNPAAVTDATTPAAAGAKFNLAFGGLAALNGKNYLGTWTLRIRDNVANGTAGTLNAWSLNPIGVTPNPPGGTPGRTFRVSFPTQTVSGSYSLVFGADSQGNYIRDVSGNRVD